MPDLSLRRQILHERYRSRIDELYGNIRMPPPLLAAEIGSNTARPPSPHTTPFRLSSHSSLSPVEEAFVDSVLDVRRSASSSSSSSSSSSAATSSGSGAVFSNSSLSPGSQPSLVASGSLISPLSSRVSMRHSYSPDLPDVAANSPPSSAASSSSPLLLSGSDDSLARRISRRRHVGSSVASGGGGE